jgi:hypothetical protein
VVVVVSVIVGVDGVVVVGVELAAVFVIVDVYH